MGAIHRKPVIISATGNTFLQVQPKTSSLPEEVFLFLSIKTGILTIEALYQLYRQNPVIRTDTRTLTPGCLYFALKGPRFNGNTFAAQALEKGASYAIIDETPPVADDRYLLVPDVLIALQELAAIHRSLLHIPFIAITGSNGKTTTKELVTAVLKKKFRVYATAGNLNNHIGVPLTLLGIAPDAEIAVIEMGASHIGEIAGYCRIAQPTHGIITNCGKAHIEGFGSEAGVRQAKGELYAYIRRHQGIIFRDTGQLYLEAMAEGIEKQVTYGQHQAMITGKPAVKDLFLHVSLNQEYGTTTLPTQLVGDYNFPNVMAALAVGLHFNVPQTDITLAVTQYQPDNSRSQLIAAGSNKIIMDAYNANPASMKAAIANFAALALPNKILWLGAMKEMGKAEQDEHKALIAFTTQYTWGEVLLVGNEFSKCRGQYHWFPTAADAAAYVRQYPPQHAVILVKGSRGSKMELLLKALEEVQTTG